MDDVANNRDALTTASAAVWTEGRRQLVGNLLPRSNESNYWAGRDWWRTSIVFGRLTWIGRQKGGTEWTVGRPTDRRYCALVAAVIVTGRSCYDTGQQQASAGLHVSNSLVMTDNRVLLCCNCARALTPADDVDRYFFYRKNVR